MNVRSSVSFASVMMLASALAAGGATLTPLPEPRNPVPPLAVTGIERIVMIILENGKPSAAAMEPFMRARAAQGAVLTHYFGVAHPSQPNYIALISGSTKGALTDSPLELHRPHLGQSLGTRWRVYADAYPALSGRCNLVKQSGPCTLLHRKRSGCYVRRHVPFLSFADVQAGDCSQIVRLDAPGDPVAALRSDIAAHALPAFAMIVPDLEHDGHEPFTVDDANAWLVANVEPLLGDPAFTTGTLFILTFDEDDTHRAKSNRVFTVLWGDHVMQGPNAGVYDHEDMLATIAAVLGVAPPPFDETGVRPIGGIWR